MRILSPTRDAESRATARYRAAPRHRRAVAAQLHFSLRLLMRPNSRVRCRAESAGGPRHREAEPETTGAAASTPLIGRSTTASTHRRCASFAGSFSMRGTSELRPSCQITRASRSAGLQDDVPAQRQRNQSWSARPPISADKTTTATRRWRRHPGSARSALAFAQIAQCDEQSKGTASLRSPTALTH